MEEVIIKGKPCPVHFGLRAISRYGQKHGIDFAELISTPELFSSFEGFAEIGAMGLNDGAERAGSDHRFTENDVWDIFEEEPELILIVSEMFVESITPLAERLGKLPKNSKRPTTKRRQK